MYNPQKRAIKDSITRQDKSKVASKVVTFSGGSGEDFFVLPEFHCMILSI